MTSDYHNRVAECLAREGFSALEALKLEVVFHEKHLVVTFTTASVEEAKALESTRQAFQRGLEAEFNCKVTVLLTLKTTENTLPPRPTYESLKQVKKIIAVASAKGGVGKSTIAVNLAVALAQSGLKVGLLDADVYGPSVPQLMSEARQPEIHDKVIIPHHKYGVSFVSMGHLIADNRAFIWRGPMIQKAIVQLLRDVQWGALDILVIDMPPGTGDAHLTLAQKINLSGAIIVTTPQKLAIDDAARGIAMFEKLNVPLLGVVANMTALPDGTKLFDDTPLRELIDRTNLPLLAEIPLNPEIASASDKGEPYALNGESVFKALCDRLDFAQSPARQMA